MSLTIKWGEMSLVNSEGSNDAPCPFSFHFPIPFACIPSGVSKLLSLHQRSIMELHFTVLVHRVNYASSPRSLFPFSIISHLFFYFSFPSHSSLGGNFYPTGSFVWFLSCVNLSIRWGVLLLLFSLFKILGVQMPVALNMYIAGVPKVDINTIYIFILSFSNP